MVLIRNVPPPRSAGLGAIAWQEGPQLTLRHGTTVAHAARNKRAAQW
ncbi:hypothetical protein I542_5553 [Mycobacteroides abscessus 1948]|uniref:Uncharacterized protein n=1 Tax=Mycobacteroides abscessus 1948 TaxID=1299323 RepID=A0A829QSL3_9MYCO|nr:hypothetical protein I542_5553 [Mycobacteroides abscessus 1948]